MGTNYYAYVNTCECCNKPEKIIHIGKASGGWTFHFRGYRNQDPEWASGEEPGTDILSYSDWKEFLQRPDVTIYDEYARDVTLEHLLELIEVKRDSKLNHAKKILDGDSEMSPILGYIPQEMKDREWLDEEGNGFSDVDFC